MPLFYFIQSDERALRRAMESQEGVSLQAQTCETQTG